MPDGGIGEDFLHVAGLIQVSAANGTMRPHLLVGIENTQRRRDLTGPTGSEDDRKIAPVVGGSAAFRGFIREELMPDVRRRYRTTREASIVGESLAGLFVVETFLLEPDLFDTYIAVDPSLWWNDRKLLEAAGARLATGRRRGSGCISRAAGRRNWRRLRRLRGRPRRGRAGGPALAPRKDAGRDALDDLPSRGAEGLPRGAQGAGGRVECGGAAWTSMIL